MSDDKEGLIARLHDGAAPYVAFKDDNARLKALQSRNRRDIWVALAIIAVSSGLPSHGLAWLVKLL